MIVSNENLLSIKDITNLMSRFEAEHDVENYVAAGWNVWPFLRTSLAWKIEQQQKIIDNQKGVCRKSNIKPVASLYQAAIKKTNMFRDWFGAIRANAFQGVAPSQKGRDVLIIESGARRQVIDGTWFHYISDPLVDKLENEGFCCLKWLIGAARFPTYRESVLILPLLVLRLWWRGSLNRWKKHKKVPTWFKEYSDFRSSLLGQSPSWESILATIQAITWMSEIMEMWMRRSGVRLVVLDCWYNWEMMAAALAAHRLQLHVMDMQHGIQEHKHFSYHGWSKAPEGGYAVMPDTFWVWGERAERLYKETNRVPQEVFCGGNLWLQRWMNDDDAIVKRECLRIQEHKIGYKKVVLFTATLPTSVQLPYLKKIISKSPDDWLWLIRVHPTASVGDKERMEQELRCASMGGRLRVDLGTNLPLYALLKECDLHVTIESTCAYEALAFGKPTILISASGAALYQDLVKDGVMFFSERFEDFFEISKKALQLDATILKKASFSFFADKARAKQQINRFIE